MDRLVTVENKRFEPAPKMSVDVDDLGGKETGGNNFLTNVKFGGRPKGECCNYMSQKIYSPSIKIYRPSIDRKCISLLCSDRNKVLQ